MSSINGPINEDLNISVSDNVDFYESSSQTYEEPNITYYANAKLANPRWPRRHCRQIGVLCTNVFDDEDSVVEQDVSPKVKQKTISKTK